MTKARIMTVIVLAALAGAVLLWKMHGRDRGVVGAASRPRSANEYDSFVAGEARAPKNSRLGPAHVQPPSRALPPETGTAKQADSPTELERVSLVVKPDSNVGFPQRVRAIRALETELTKPELDAFSSYLRTSAKNSPGPEGENWLRNVMLDEMVQQPALPLGFSDLLVAIYQDHAQDDVMRDYAVQHMAPAYERVSPKEQAKLREALWQATTETDTSIAGTALLSLLDVSQTNPSIDQRLVAQAAFNLAADDRYGELTRITAVQACGRLKVDAAWPVIVQLAQEAESVPLRIAATAALGDLGRAEAKPLLKRLANSSEPRQSLAAQSALQRLARAQKRLAKQTGS